jgi:hypothetical protein
VRAILSACFDATPVEALLTEYQAAILLAMLKAPVPLKEFLLDQVRCPVADILAHCVRF